MRRMDECSLCKKLTFSQPEGSRKKKKTKIKAAGWCIAGSQSFKSDSLVEEGTRQG
jgi:hypothetical protein